MQSFKNSHTLLMQAIRDADPQAAISADSNYENQQSEAYRCLRLIDYPGEHTGVYPLNLAILLIEAMDTNDPYKDNRLKIINWLFNKNACFDFYTQFYSGKIDNLSATLYQHPTIWPAVLNSNRKLAIIKHLVVDQEATDNQQYSFVASIVEYFSSKKREQDGTYNWLTYAIHQADKKRVAILVEHLDNNEIEIMIATLCDTKKRFNDFYQTHQGTIKAFKRLHNIFNHIKNYLNTIMIDDEANTLPHDNFQYVDYTHSIGRYIQITEIDYEFLEPAPTQFCYNDTIITLMILQNRRPTAKPGHSDRFQEILHYPGSFGLSALDWALRQYKKSNKDYYSFKVTTIVDLIDKDCFFNSNFIFVCYLSTLTHYNFNIKIARALFKRYQREQHKPPPLGEHSVFNQLLTSPLNMCDTFKKSHRDQPHNAYRTWLSLAYYNDHITMFDMLLENLCRKHLDILYDFSDMHHILDHIIKNYKDQTHFANAITRHDPYAWLRIPKEKLQSPESYDVNYVNILIKQFMNMQVKQACDILIAFNSTLLFNQVLGQDSAFELAKHKSWFHGLASMLFLNAEKNLHTHTKLLLLVTLAQHHLWEHVSTLLQQTNWPDNDPELLLNITTLADKEHNQLLSHVQQYKPRVYHSLQQQVASNIETVTNNKQLDISRELLRYQQRYTGMFNEFVKNRPSIHQRICSTQAVNDTLQSMHLENIHLAISNQRWHDVLETLQHDPILADKLTTQQQQAIFSKGSTELIDYLESLSINLSDYSQIEENVVALEMKSM